MLQPCEACDISEKRTMPWASNPYPGNKAPYSNIATMLPFGKNQIAAL